MDQKELDSLLVNHLNGSLSVDEQLKLNDLLHHSTEAQTSFKKICAVWEKSQSAKKFFEIEKCINSDFEAVMNRVGHTKQVPVRRLNAYFSRLAAASVLFVLMAAGATYLYLNVAGFGRWSEVEASINNQLVELPDHSSVWLNKNSRVAFVNNTSENVRLVKISGEAFFDVQHNSQKPFVVKAGKTQVKVLGTSFNVKVDKKRSSTEVFVSNGKVEFGRDKNKLILLPNEKGIYKKGKLSKIKLANANVLYWRTQEIVFAANTLAEVAGTLETLFSEIEKIHLVSGDSTTRITTKFENQSLNDIFKELQVHFNKKFTLKDGTLIISD